MKDKKVAIISNIPAPYRENVYSILSKNPEIDLKVFYCKKIESDRKWELNKPKYNHSFLKSFTINYGEMHLHFNISILSALKKFKPDVIITNGFALPMLIGFLYSFFNNKSHGSFIDGTLITEKKLSFIHKIVRKFIYSRSKIFIGPSNQTIKLFKSYGISSHQIFKSCLAIDNEKFIRQKKSFNQKKYDLLFSGQFIDRKCPFFFTEVVNELTKIKKNLKVVVIGSGILEKKFRKSLEKTGADIYFKGFMKQSDLPNIYSNSKVFLMPTKEDCWGVVANESLAAGTPVITTPFAGVAGELIINNETGFVVDLNSKDWVEKTLILLEGNQLYDEMSNKGVALVKEYNYNSASDGILKSILSL